MKRILGMTFAALLFVSPAMAGIGEGDSELGFDFGQTAYDDNVMDEKGTAFAIRGGHFLTPMFEVEGQYLNSSEETSILGTNVDTTMQLLMVNGLFNFHPREDIVPYVLVGLGRASLDVNVAGISFDDDSIAYQFGGGSRFYFGESKRAAFRFDVTFVNEDTFNQSSTHTNVTGGFTWKLGR